VRVEEQTLPDGMESATSSQDLVQVAALFKCVISARPSLAVVAPSWSYRNPATTSWSVSLPQACASRLLMVGRTR